MQHPVYVQAFGGVTASGSFGNIRNAADLKAVPTHLGTLAGDQPYPYFSIEEHYGLFDEVRSLEVVEAIVEDIFSQSGLAPGEVARCALVFAGSTLDLSASRIIRNARDPEALAQIPGGRYGSGLYAAKTAERFGIKGPRFTLNTACTSGANALLEASRMVAQGVAEHALVVGVELYSRMNIEGFAALQLLDGRACRPFDADRSGIVLGEGAAAVLLGTKESSWRFLGGSSNCETHSITGAAEDGSGIAELMQQALEQSGLRASDVAVVKAHGTASRLNDLSESNAMKKVFGQQMPPFFSFKGFFGHTLGACGVVEPALLMQCVDHGFLPASAGFMRTDETLGIAPMQTHAACDSGIFMLDFFGFGGNNAALLLEKAV